MNVNRFRHYFVIINDFGPFNCSINISNLGMFRNAIITYLISTTLITSFLSPIFSTEDATKKKCVQDCPSTSEYNPMCGTDNVTYINPGKFLCAQNCGVGKSAYENYNIS